MKDLRPLPMAPWADELDRPKEECGIVGLYNPPGGAGRLAFFGLFALQHRGQESAGIASADGHQVRTYKGMGLVAHVFDDERIFTETLLGEFAVGHTRYSTTGSAAIRNAQPIYCQSQVGDLAVAHNGNLINAASIRARLISEGEKFDGTNDSEVMARLIVHNLHLGLEEAIRETMRQIQGAYSVVVLTRDRVIGFRDPNGVRPLVAGALPDGGSILASETCAFGPLGAKFIREVEPGEMVVIDRDGMHFREGIQGNPETMCLFEFIYFARPDSRMMGTSLYQARMRMGEQLAREHPCEADVVVPVPDSGIPAALGYSEVSGIPFSEGMMKSRYIHRTFIQPDQRMRELGVRMKLSPIDEHIAGKRVVLVDDSIVRGTTTKQIVKMMFESGAKEVHVRITAPPIKFPCFYGIDMANSKELVAGNHTIEEIGTLIGATSIGYLSIDGAAQAVRDDGKGFCLACFSGNYPIPVPADVDKMAFEDGGHTGEFEAVGLKQLPLFD